MATFVKWGLDSMASEAVKSRGEAAFVGKPTRVRARAQATQAPDARPAVVAARSRRRPKPTVFNSRG